MQLTFLPTWPALYNALSKNGELKPNPTRFDQPQFFLFLFFFLGRMKSMLLAVQFINNRWTDC